MIAGFARPTHWHELIRPAIEEEERLDNWGTMQEKSCDGQVAFAWETLPELPKSRWEEVVAFDVTIENWLAKAKADRSRAEVERQRIAKDVCGEIVTVAERTLASANRMEAQAPDQLGKTRLMRTRYVGPHLTISMQQARNSKYPAIANFQLLTTRFENTDRIEYR